MSKSLTPNPIDYARSTRSPFKVLAVILMLAGMAGCASNPVTGNRELGLVSQAAEISMGQEHYRPSQQSQGGLYQIDSGLSAYVNQVGQRVAAVADRNLPYEFVVLNSSVPNAWALPGGKIAINRGLLVELGSEAELAAVLGHEVVHAAARHGAQAMERGMLLQGAMIATAIAASDNQYAGMIVGGAQVGAQLITQRYGREAEREADAYGIRYMVEAGYDPNAAVSLQQTFLRLSEGRGSSNWLDGMFASHPPSAERVQNNQALVQQLRAEGHTGGDLGVQRYQSNMAFLHETKPAYDAFDEAMALMAQNNIEDAHDKLDQAIRLLPREARFHGMKGNANLNQRNYRAAIQNYNRALEYDSQYFEYYLGRGLTYSRQGDRARAEADLQASVNLLPTAAAMNELGGLALQRNDISAAKQYYEVAATAQGSIGDSARAAYARLDVGENPARYVNVQAFYDNSGKLMARVSNQSPVNMTSLVIQFRAAMGSQREERNITINRLNSGSTVDIDSTLALPAGVAPSAVQVATALTSVRVAQ